ncbi:hypothetical protein Pmani_002017 [Petrolisthes manimaculis]|uniref:Uncharacterized protein n=1 Tax=Petrolisthes manimaculis TaxID=1843537 RepID=A0AAE1QJH2_9EUCA|nr:hypothetical protein Pmani_002017 [Petrolisthes manimaculis]
MGCIQASQHLTVQYEGLRGITLICSKSYCLSSPLTTPDIDYRLIKSCGGSCTSDLTVQPLFVGQPSINNNNNHMAFIRSSGLLGQTAGGTSTTTTVQATLLPSINNNNNTSNTVVTLCSDGRRGEHKREEKKRRTQEKR